MTRPSGHSSVMARRDTSRDGTLDYFPTPPWAARAGGELIKRIDPAARTCWEPACGEGHMTWGLKDYFEQVHASDLFDYGFGWTVDFLDPLAAARYATEIGPVDWIVTNPPFKDGEAFVRAALPRARRGVAMLLRSVFIESAGRWPLFHDPALGFAVSAPFAERVPMVKGRWDPQASSATSYAWFVWLKGGIGLVKAGGDLGYPIRVAQRHGVHVGMVIPPGTKARLSKREDLARFCSSSGELFEAAP